MVQAISRGGGDCNKKGGLMCARFSDIGSQAENQVENGLNIILNFRGQTIDVSDQAFIILKYFGLHYEEGKKINTSHPLKARQRQEGSFLSFKMKVHPDHSDTKYKHSRMTCRACVQPPHYMYIGINYSIYPIYI